MAVTTGLPVVQVNVDKLITCTSAVPQSISYSKGIVCGKAAAGFLALQCNIGPTLAALTGDLGTSWNILGQRSLKSAVPLLPFVLAGVFRVTVHMVGFLLDESLEKIEVLVVKKRNCLELFAYHETGICS